MNVGIPFKSELKHFKKSLSISLCVVRSQGLKPRSLVLKPESVFEASQSEALDHKNIYSDGHILCLLIYPLLWHLHLLLGSHYFAMLTERPSTTSILPEL